LLILNHMWSQRQLTTAEAAQLVQKPEADARRQLQRLVEAGLVEPRGGRPLPALAPPSQGSAC
jgi:ATP-dependent DNA helicase RecG